MTAGTSPHRYGDAAVLPALVKVDSGPAVLRVIHYDQVAPLHASLAEVPAGHQREAATARLVAGFPVHTDSSLLTLAPRASMPGLAVRDYSSGEWVRRRAHALALSLGAVGFGVHRTRTWS
jgi:isopenicillin N synthase-like dioxygenase